MAAALTTNQKAQLIVTTESGGAVAPGAVAINTGGATCVTVVVQGGSSPANWIVAQAPGEATLAVSANGQVGSLEVSVTAAPLTVTLGPAVPK